MQDGVDGREFWSKFLGENNKFNSTTTTPSSCLLILLLPYVLKEKSKLQVRADKQLDTAIKSIEKLKDVGFQRFLTQLSHFGDLNEWNKAIYDFATIALTTAEIVTDVAQDTAESHKRYVHIWTVAPRTSSF
jgi:hypothetical protein